MPPENLRRTPPTFIHIYHIYVDNQEQEQYNNNNYYYYYYHYYYYYYHYHQIKINGFTILCSRDIQLQAWNSIVYGVSHHLNCVISKGFQSIQFEAWRRGITDSAPFSSTGYRNSDVLT